MKQKSRIQDPQESRSQDIKTEKRHPRSVGSHNKINVQGTRTTGSHDKIPRGPSAGSDRNNVKIQDANFIKIVSNPGNVILNTWQFSYASWLN